MRLILPLVALVLAACAPPADPGPDACGAAGLQGLIGQPESVLAATTFAGPIRIIRPGDAVTEDYSASRTNVMLDAQGRITAITCG